MTRPRPDSPCPRAFAAEYQRATGCAVEVTWRDAARQWIKGDYVDFLEYELKKARKQVAQTRIEKEVTDGHETV